MNNIIQNKINTVLVFSEVEPTGTVTLKIDGSTRVYSVSAEYCNGVVSLSVEHECDNRNKFNLDIGNYTGILLDDGEEFTRFDFTIYKK